MGSRADASVALPSSDFIVDDGSGSAGAGAGAGAGADADGPKVKVANYRKMLRQASSYASFNVQPREEHHSVFKTGKPVVCYTIILLCTVMLVIEIGTNGWKVESTSVNPTFGPSVETLLVLGAKRADLILEGDWYRLVAPIFLHAGVLHYFFNMLGLWSIGFPLERQFGSHSVAYIFLLSGFMGVVISAIFSPSVVGIGASGGIFGLFGAAWSELVLNLSLYEGEVCRSFVQLALATCINLAIGLMPFLDNFAHIGGFFTGVVTGLGVLVSNRYTRYGELKERKTYQVCLQVVSVITTPVMVVAALFVLYFGSEAEEWCSWCKYLTCVPFPPGDTKWWTCDQCGDAGVTAEFVNANDITLTCPDGTLVNTTAPTGLADDFSLLIGVCRQVCT